MLLISRVSGLYSCFLILATSLAQLDSSKPYPYPGIPSGSYGPNWQTYYEVKENLPNITWKLPRSYAGSVSVNRKGHEDNSLFFIAYEKEDGSLAAKEGERENDPWMIWLNGGPGTSSLLGLFIENGPIRFTGDSQYVANGTNVKENPDSWHKLADIFFVEQPVGVGYSTCDSTGYVADENEVGEDFVQFLTNLVEIFPSLKRRPLYLTGESYAGTYIPYIAKAVFSKPNPPVKLVKLAIGDGQMGRDDIAENIGTLQLIQTYPQMIGFNTSLYDYLEEQFNLCGYNVTFSYPEKGYYPDLGPPRASKVRRGRDRDSSLNPSRLITSLDMEKLSHLIKRQVPGIDLPVPPLTGVINETWECNLIYELVFWTASYMMPWVDTGIHFREFDFYRVSDALKPQTPQDPAVFLNDPTVQSALHAPKKVWAESISYPWGNDNETLYDPSPAPQIFLSDLMRNVSIVFYSGNDDSRLSHRGTELAIQNSTFGGIQGFTKKPSTPWTDDEGNFAGIVHQERNVTYALFYGAGHFVPTDKPKAATVFYRDFVLGSSRTGLVMSNGEVVGGENEKYIGGVLTASEVLTGSYTIGGTVTWAQDVWKSWDSYIATKTKEEVPLRTPGI